MRRLLIPVLACALLLAGCASQGDQVSSEDGVTEWKTPLPAVDFRGPTVDGTTFRSTDHRGDVLVVNFWYASCGPCNAEAPTLRALAQRFDADKVQFVGINIEDNRDNAASFERQYRVGYPSVLDQSNAAAAQLAFQSVVPSTAVPSTLVLDRKGRVVSRVIGQVDRSTLQTLIQDAVDGKAA